MSEDEIRKEPKLPTRKEVCLHSAEMCPTGCMSPMVVLEQHLANENASRRFWVVCPTCRAGFRIVALAVSEKIGSDIKHVTLAEGTCVFDTQPHDPEDCGFCSEQDKPEIEDCGDTQVIPPPRKKKRKNRKKKG